MPKPKGKINPGSTKGIPSPNVGKIRPPAAFVRAMNALPPDDKAEAERRMRNELTPEERELQNNAINRLIRRMRGDLSLEEKEAQQKAIEQTNKTYKAAVAARDEARRDPLCKERKDLALKVAQLHAKYLQETDGVQFLGAEAVTLPLTGIRHITGLGTFRFADPNYTPLDILTVHKLHLRLEQMRLDQMKSGTGHADPGVEPAPTVETGWIRRKEAIKLFMETSPSLRWEAKTVGTRLDEWRGQGLLKTNGHVGPMLRIRENDVIAEAHKRSEEASRREDIKRIKKREEPTQY